MMWCNVGNNRNCSQIDSGIGDICTLPLDASMMQSRFTENGGVLGNKVLAAVKPPPVERFPIKVEDLEDYVMTRRNNNSEELRNEYRVRRQRSLIFNQSIRKLRTKVISGLHDNM